MTVRKNPVARYQLLRSPTGPVGQDMTRRLQRVTNRAKVLCPVRKPTPGRRRSPGGRLRAAQTYTGPTPIPTGLVGQVGSNIEYSMAVHEGSGSEWAPRSWRIAHARGNVIPPRRFLTNALPAGRV